MVNQNEELKQIFVEQLMLFVLSSVLDMLRDILLKNETELRAAYSPDIYAYIEKI